MKNNKVQSNGEQNKIVLYKNKNGKVELRADIERDTLWGTQEQIAEIFQVSSQNITIHFRNIFNSKELHSNSVCKESLHTGKDGKQYLTKFYNLDAIIAVGYRVNSKKATQFRIWATSVLRKYLVDNYLPRKKMLSKSINKVDDLHEAIDFMESKNNLSPIKGRLTLKIFKDIMK